MHLTAHSFGNLFESVQKVLVKPTTAKDWLSWGYEFGIRLSDNKRRERREKKEAGTWDPSVEVRHLSFAAAFKN